MGAALRVGWPVLAVWLLALSMYDVRDRRLPDVLTVPGAAVVIAVAAAAGSAGPAVAGALSLAALYLALHLISPRGMGAGDVKLALGVGALTGSFGVAAWFLAALVAPLLTLLLGLGWPARSGRPGIPHGPSMCAASAAAVALTLT